MKIITKIVLIFAVFLLVPLTTVFADLPPDPGGGPGSGDLPVGGGAPIGGGLIILTALGVGYASKKIFDARNKIME
jgi:hypothetical protein